MLIHAKILFYIVLFLPSLLFSQTSGKYSDFSKVDSTSRTIKYKKDIYKLSSDLTKPYPEQLLKARAIFIWITENINYDYKLFNKGPREKKFRCKSELDCQQQKLEWEITYITRILKKKKGICDGYARLFKKMCDIAGIKSEIIVGYTKTKPYQIGNIGIADHAWNAIWLDSAYYLLDATWAAGFCDEDESTGKLLGFHKKFDNYYWLTPFNDFARNHYPQNNQWVWEPGYTREKFAANPYYNPGIISNIRLLMPESGIIEASKGDTIHFVLEYDAYFRHLQINTNVFRNPTVFKWENVSKKKRVWQEDTLALKKQLYVNYKTDGNKFEFDYVITDNSLYYLEVLFDYTRVMRFKVKIKQ